MCRPRAVPRACGAARGVPGECRRRHIEDRPASTQLIRHEQAHVLVQRRPAHFERRHEVVIHEELVGRHARFEFSLRRGTLRARARPARGPGLEAQIADARGRVGRLLGRERPRLNGGSAASVFARNASSRLRVRYAVSSWCMTNSISRLRSASFAARGSSSAASSSARGRSGITPASVSSSMTASIVVGMSSLPRTCLAEALAPGAETSVASWCAAVSRAPGESPSCVLSASSSTARK